MLSTWCLYVHAWKTVHIIALRNVCHTEKPTICITDVWMLFHLPIIMIIITNNSIKMGRHLVPGAGRQNNKTRSICLEHPLCCFTFLEVSALPRAGHPPHRTSRVPGITHCCLTMDNVSCARSLVYFSLQRWPIHHPRSRPK